jgi:serine/threonine-protein kinase HipA
MPAPAKSSACARRVAAAPMNKLDVYYCGWGERWLLGTLAEHQGEVLFEYAPSALQAGLELSPLHLPLRSGSFGRFPAHFSGLPGLLADALPDGWGMLLMDKLFRKHGLDPRRISILQRLAFIGDRAIGALSFVPAQELPLSQPDQQLLQLAQEAQQVLQGREIADLQQLAMLGGSPHGARPKVLLDYQGQPAI